ncbi:sterol O-acyltransferase 1-like [Ischnura elegans]|uniref:sterol O-acyltransferase 1-like n=1 Tax=Ischnura elegans TaxID=197161 RepID=UPI001ED887A5|nr:sterol O-acyltransferase 1-like [Ischnura elegans]
MENSGANLSKEDSSDDKHGSDAGGTNTHDGEHMDSKQQLLQEMTFEMRKSHDLIMEQMMDLFNEFIHRDESPKNSGAIGESAKYRNRVKAKKGALQEKQFLPRNSLLTDLFEIKHIKTIYHIFMAILILLFLNAAVCDFVEHGKFDFGLDLILWNFNELRTVLLFWVGMMVCTLMLYSCFSSWANGRIQLRSNKKILKLWDYGCLLALVVYLVAFLYIPCTMLMARDIPPASSAIILLEQVRLLMKSHAFIRSNVPRALKSTAGDSDDVKDHTICPGFSKFLYFLFAPTLVYRDSYPRTKMIRWKVVAWHFAEVAEIIFYSSFVFSHFLMPSYKNFGLETLKVGTLTVNLFKSMMPSMLIFLCGFYLLLHCWMNAFAEMMQFSDRMFYKDWWTSSTFAMYYRTWNVVVHDWLYTYVYKDVHELLSPPGVGGVASRSRVIPQLMVFGVSALFHEYIITFCLRSFYPVLLIIFGVFGVLLVFLTKYEGAGGNIFMWLAICSGNGIVVSLYFMEWYARKHCPPHPDPHWDFYVPRSWYCSRLEY